MAPIRSAFCTSGHGTCVSVYLSLCLFLFSPMLCLIHECQLCLSPTSQQVFLISDFDGVLVHTHTCFCVYALQVPRGGCRARKGLCVVTSNTGIESH